MEGDLQFIKQCKGKSIDKVPESKFLEGAYICTVKYDGTYVQIHKKYNKVKFFTSGGKEFYWKDVADVLLNIPTTDFILEAEYVGDSLGLLGDRKKASTGHDRSEFTKGRYTNLGKGRLFIFDVITEHKASDRYSKFNSIVSCIEATKCDLNITAVELWGQSIVRNIQEFLKCAEQLNEVMRNINYEGFMFRHEDQKYLSGKRVNDLIKVKHRPTADLVCIAVIEGQGKYEGLIGSLILTDEEGKEVSVGSGLSDEDREKADTYFIGKTVEIEYEQILDTYIQPVYKQIRKDKS